MISMVRGGFVALLIVAGAYSTTSNAADWRRFIEVKDNQLTIKTPPIISPISGKESISTLTWERIK
jgi:hypothetical protein